MSFPRDLVEVLAAFVDGGVRFLVIGGHAVSLHARPRATKDLDLWLDATAENIRLACAALARFGAPSHIVEDLRAAAPDEIVWMGRAPARIDLLQTIPGVSFASAWRRKVTFDIEGTSVPFIGLADLVTNKRAVGRARDLRDVRALERARAKLK